MLAAVEVSGHLREVEPQVESKVRTRQDKVGKVGKAHTRRGAREGRRNARLLLILLLTLLLTLHLTHCGERKRWSTSGTK